MGSRTTARSDEGKGKERELLEGTVWFLGCYNDVMPVAAMVQKECSRNRH